MKAKKVDKIPLFGALKKLIGFPESSGSWFLMGDSGNGKSTFLMQLCSILCLWYKVDYYSFEEEDRGSMQELMAENKMSELKKGRFMLCCSYSFQEMKERLSAKRSAKICVIDSIQYFEITKKQYLQLLNQFPNKLFIINSHAKGKEPKGALADFIRFHSDLKLWAEGFKVFSTSRMSRGVITAAYTIWEEGANNYWNKI